MARVRKIILSIASGSVLYSGMAPAVGLGEITINSALNQPLEAEIELLQVGDLSEQEMRIALASPDAFMRAGVERPLFLDDLRFTTLLRGSKSVIRVVSSKPIREPYLNFVVEMTRPTGRVLREYTLLIDPPEALADRPQGVGFQRRAETPASRMQLPAVSTPPAVVQGNTYRVLRGDSLWKIAKRVQAAGGQAELARLMADIHALNPQAFVGGDSERLIAGATLLLPDQLSHAGGAAAASSAAPFAASAPAPSAPVVGPGAGQLADAAGVAGVQRQLDAVLATQEQERLQLQQQLDELHSQLASLRQQVASKNEQVEALQARILVQPAPPAGSVPVAAQPSAAVPSETPAPVGENPFGWIPGWLLGLLGGSLLSAMAGGILWWRRREPDDGPERIFADYQKTRSTTPMTPARVRVAPPVEPMAEHPGVQAGESHSVNVAQPDALDGANIYLAYGRLDEAREVLQRTLEKQPARNDVRLRLLELLAKMGDSAAFAEHEQLLLSNAGDPERLAHIKSAHPELAAGKAEDLLHDPLAKPDQAVTPQAGNDVLDDLPLNLDPLPLDTDWGVVGALESAATAQPPMFDDDSLFGQLELPEVNDISAVPEALDTFANLQSKAMSAPAPEHASSDPFGEDHRHLGRNLDHLASHPQSLSRLNMALAYIDQGDLPSACAILNQLISDGDDRQRQEARAILARIA
ncbi:FimV family protein [Pseudomonas sp. N040]|uniref:FimV family protein n=1 Tax=Pseudomonas sp. N040 TaxID=2785325 RepID=UPI0018A309D0|nr:FimV family protein [Pseudomonas sp. N040]MBF7729460.1 FimV family protein [Pseudomonas sp. N040]MBW7013100.1 peptidoglycan-binding protein LysM [Pseudomonas sp. N040]